MPLSVNNDPTGPDAIIFFTNVSDKPFQPSIMHKVRSGAYPSSGRLNGASLRQALVLPANFGLSWKGLPGTNQLAYYELT